MSLTAINKLLGKVFGTANEREIKRILPVVDQINALEESVKRLSDDELRQTASVYRHRLTEILGQDPALTAPPRSALVPVRTSKPGGKPPAAAAWRIWAHSARSGSSAT